MSSGVVHLDGAEDATFVTDSRAVAGQNPEHGNDKHMDFAPNVAGSTCSQPPANSRDFYVLTLHPFGGAESLARRLLKRQALRRLFEFGPVAATSLNT